ncbi:ERF family protein [Actinoplanes palleronii]|uniref:ERF superfamily protein n=1 Tax=Actinoplanes palleronii TaxID=113570 RepID=A0ABQ4B3Y1_9ACTN|nr:ERF family protein [Actinoplanes palleronii]GIE65376.1 hypothetical protein Apa02nite_014840 [Actinoplanes palleronii]
MNLRERATAVAAGETGPSAGPERQGITSEPLEDITYTGAITDAEKVPVHVAFARVMADVQSIGKGDQRNDTGGRYAFRGVDRVVNAVGPALRRHGVLMLPTRILELEHRESRTTNNKVMQDVTVKVQWTVIGPAGDMLPPLESAGQATDTSDKGTAKAISVAQRVLLLTSLQIPTQDPDVDRGHERGERPGPTPAEYRDEIVNPRTSIGRLRQISSELREHRVAGALVVNEVGDEEALSDLYIRVVAERRSEAGQ